ncbi:aminoacyl-tRNA hydrolase [Govanella unica]|uniref:aminoacyl-tRNA hydrolase n=1 Tax=Govanella unica TaxID=2975056 RepID=UPI0023A8978E|nr:aminoacyl-tRNA hydrolase [Govania unica]
MLLVVGLGNPGAQYAYNRHNIGFLAVDDIVHRHNFSPWRQRFSALVAEGRLGAEKAIVMKPMTFMNRSGQAVGAAMQFYKLDPADVIVIHDELDLLPGQVKVKRGGGAGGHNGLRDIDAHIGRDYLRVRLGIGHPGHRDRVTGFVLSDFSRADEDWLDPLIEAVAALAPVLPENDGAKFTSELALRYRHPAASAAKTTSD